MFNGLDWPEIMLVVALTGGIASGKTTVSRRFEELGIPIIDADLIAREQVEPYSPAFHEIKEQFGSAVIGPDGRVNRGKLRKIVFDSPEKRHLLEQILHPRIREEMENRLTTLDAPYVILVIPLLLETDQQNMADRILVVDCPKTEQIRRLHQRNGFEEKAIQQILNAQVDRSTRLAAADDVIENTGTIDELLVATDQLHQKYLHMPIQANLEFEIAKNSE